jgi:exopolyphosphatase / guanosine-5'-triphosphate,3'-diphosphate pyrophosphatase
MIGATSDRPITLCGMQAEAMPERVAVIDLGSNSFRMVVFASRGESWERERELSAPVRIGEGLAASGRLSAAGIARALDTLDRFAAVCAQAGLDAGAIDAVATSAIRDADNGAELLALVRERTGFEVRVLSRGQEARYGYLAAVHTTTLSDGYVLDLGGGSLQLVRVAGRIARESGSWRLGAVRMTERFLPGPGPAKRSQCKALQAHVARKLESAPWLANAGERLIGLGGTVRNLASAADRGSIPHSGHTAGSPPIGDRRDLQSASQRAAGLPAEQVQGFLLEREVLGELIERLAALPAAERSKVAGIKPARADIVLAGALTIDAVMRRGGFAALEVTAAGLREGIFFERRLLARRLESQELGARAA